MGTKSSRVKGIRKIFRAATGRPFLFRLLTKVLAVITNTATQAFWTSSGTGISPVKN